MKGASIHREEKKRKPRVAMHFLDAHTVHVSWHLHRFHRPFFFSADLRCRSSSNFTLRGCNVALDYMLTLLATKEPYSMNFRGYIWFFDEFFEHYVLHEYSMIGIIRVPGRINNWVSWLEGSGVSVDQDGSSQIYRWRDFSTLILRSKNFEFLLLSGYWIMQCVMQSCFGRSASSWTDIISNIVLIFWIISLMEEFLSFLFKCWKV